MTATAVSDGVLIHYEVAGSGPPLLLIAGTGYPGATWPPDLVERLSRDFSVIVYDHRGTGKSEAGSESYSTRLFAEDASRLLETVGMGPALVVGHSMGGRVAQWLARLRPERVDGLVLAATGAGGSKDHQAAAGLPIQSVVSLVELGYEHFIRERQRRTFFTEEFARAQPDRVRWLGDAFWENHPSLEDYLKHVVARQEHDARSFLSSIRQPTLVLVGSRDTHGGDTGSHLSQALYLADHIPGAKLVILSDVSHGFFWQDPGAAVDAIDEWWLAEPARTTK